VESGFVGRALREACLAELRALKPGNVHDYAPGHGMFVADFEASAEAVAAAFEREGLGVGARIHDCIKRTRALVSCNTNLGIVLLCVPLAHAVLGPGDGTLRDRLGRVLRGLTVEDANEAFRAIVLAEPAGLGDSEAHDVHAPAQVTLLEAMDFARERDRIARQYVTDYEAVFELGLPRFREGLARWNSEPWALASLFLGFVAAFPDSHIAREHGPDAAESVRRRAVAYDQRLRAAAAPAALTETLLEFDRALKAEGLNPGTSADLTVATHFADLLERALAS